MLSFIGQFLSNFHHTGAVLPSSRRLAEAMTRPLQEAAGPKRVLEVGAGTGAFTRSILTALGEGDELHIVELNPIFCRRLESNLITPFRCDHPRVGIHLHRGLIQTVALDGHFDFIVCGLPFNNFPTTVVRSVFRRLLDLLAEGGQLAYFEYAGVGRLAAPLAGPRQRRRLRRLRAIGQILHRRHAGRRELVLVNVPPAYAVHLGRRMHNGIKASRHAESGPPLMP